MGGFHAWTDRHRRRGPGAVWIAIGLGLLLGARVAADAPGAGGKPFWSVPLVSAIPTAQELAAVASWPQASALTGFSGLSSGQLSRLQPVVWLARTEAALVVAWRVPRLGQAPFAKGVGDRDGAVWNDDAVEIFIDPGHTHRAYSQLIVNPAGALYDGRGRDPSWSSTAEIGVAESATAWAGTCTLAFAALAVPPPEAGTVWSCNLAFDRSPAQRPGTGWQSEEAVIVWSAVNAVLHEADRFGHLLFAAQRPVQLAGLGQPHWRELSVSGRVPGGELSAVLQDAAGQDVWQAGSGADGEAFQLKAPVLAAGLCTLQLRARQAGAECGLTQVRFTAVPEFEPRFRYLALRRRLELEVAQQSAPPYGPTAVDVSLLGTDGRSVRDGVLQMADGRSTHAVCWELADLAPGPYRVVFRQADPGPEPALLAEVPWTPPAPPEWLGSQAGLSDDNWVPQPWTPLRVRPAAPPVLECWGRDMTLTAAGLPATLRSAAAELLAGPVVWRATANGQAVTWSGAGVTDLHAAPGAVTYAAAAAGAGLRLRGTGRLEFDGFLKLSYTVESSGAAVSLDQLDLEIPLRTELARLLHYYPKPSVWVTVNMGRFNARALPAEGWASPFLYHVWVGDEERGLQWLAESDEGWRPADPNRAIELIRQGETTTLVLHVIGRPTRLERPLTLNFALQASPVKPWPAAYHGWNYAQVASYGIETQRHPGADKDLRLAYPAAGSIRPAAGTVELEVTPRFESGAPGETNHSLFSMVWPADTRQEPAAGIWFYWNQDDKGMRVVLREGDQFVRIYGAPTPWQAGETHALAFTWGEGSRIFVDGREVARSDGPCRLAPETDLREAQVVVGGRDSAFALRQLRIADAALPPERLGAAGTTWQAEGTTLLLDRFEALTEEGNVRLSTPLRAPADARGRFAAGVVMGPAGVELANPRFDGTTLDYLKQQRLKWLGFHEHWSDWQGFPRTGHTAALRSLLDACHQRDLKLILYHSWQLADTAPEYPLYLAECEVVDPQRFIYTRQPKQTDYPVCARSAWADFMAAGVERLFREFSPDGIYSDGLSYPSECANALHGCGYVGEDGTRRPTCSIFPIRDAMKRFRRILDDQGRETLFVVHTSGSITLPTLSLADVYLDAEHLTAQARPFRLSLDTFRAEFMGHNFGVPAYFLVYDWNQGMTTPEGMAVSLLHDTELPWSYEAMAPVREAWADLGVATTQFLPYWRASEWLAEAPAGVRASAWVRADGQALLVAANLGEQPSRGVLRLHRQISAAREVLGRREVTPVGGAIDDLFPVWETRLYRVTLQPLR